uniref:Uncharacterized protein n=1 Tax=Gasterosteus aculeatus TaxID=69293 RepID=G3PA12_GASAC
MLQDRSGTSTGLLATVMTSHSVLMITSTIHRPRAPRHSIQLLGPRPFRSTRASHSACITRQARQPENSTPKRNRRAAQLVE